MKIPQLPILLEELARKNQKIYRNKYTDIKSDDLPSAFIWDQTKEGDPFWNELHCNPTIEKARQCMFPKDRNTLDRILIETI